MVVKMMRWRPWPPQSTTTPLEPPTVKKYEVKLAVKRVENWGSQVVEAQPSRLTVEIKWKGGGPSKVAVALMRRKFIKCDVTKEACCGLNDGVLCWDDDAFSCLCNFTPSNNSNNKENNNSNGVNGNNNSNVTFYPWEVTFALLDGSKLGPKNKTTVLATGSLNLAEYASLTEQKEFDLSIPLNVSGGGNDTLPSLHISLSMLELRTTQDSGDSVQRTIAPMPSSTQPEVAPVEKDELSALKAGLRKVKILTEYVSSRRAKKACREEESSEGRCSGRSDDEDYLVDSESIEEFGEGETDEGKDEGVKFRKSFSYGTLAYANYMGGSFFSSTRMEGEDEDWVYYSHRKSDVGCTVNEDASSSVPEPPLFQSSKRSILPWRKRKLNFRSPKAKGEPLLKKAYAEEGGDDIDFDRRQLSSDESVYVWHKTEDELSANRTSISEFGDDNFAVGSWEQKEIVSRDGEMKLYAQVFFASIDQRSERAAGESACTALVAVIADWFHNNRDIMPIKSQFDSLIRDGSLEWRHLCENETYKERFPDKHFDLDTVLQAKIRPLSVHPGKSFIGFFHPEETIEGKFDFLQGAMSFDSIWDEVSRASLECPSNGEPHVFIISWNDHFFILKVEPDAYFIVDTLGERLYEGCDQAYIQKFDRNTKVVKLPARSQPSDEKASVDRPMSENGTGDSKVVGEQNKSEEEEVICQGKEACKDYIKKFLAALPIRELLTDLKKGLVASPPLHRLQVEFHYTRFLSPLPADTSYADEVPATANSHYAVEVTVPEVAA